MSFVKPTAEAGKEEESQLPMKVWQALDGEKRSGIHPENLKIFTAAIMKIILAAEPTKVEPGDRYGTFTEDGKLMINQQQATRIHKDFILMYLNRTAYSVRTTKTVEEVGEYTFKPSLCEQSVSIVNSTRVKQQAKDQVESSAPAKPIEHAEQLIQTGKEKDAYKTF